MIYPVILQSRLLTTNEVGERDEICFEGRAMASLREDGTCQCATLMLKIMDKLLCKGLIPGCLCREMAIQNLAYSSELVSDWRVSMSYRKENLIWLHRPRTLINKFKQTFQK